MSTHTNDTTDIPPAAEPAATPLVSAAQLSLSDYPLVHIPEERVYALREWAQRIADTTSGTTDNHLTGLLGEDALAQVLGIADRLNTEVYADGGDGGVDLRYRGATIDVKTVGRHRIDPDLTVDAYDQLRADYYVLASRVGQTDVRLLGYAPRQFVANAPTWTHEGRAYHLVEQAYLFPLMGW